MYVQEETNGIYCRLFVTAKTTKDRKQQLALTAVIPATWEAEIRRTEA
jgi:hypothetical protein